MNISANRGASARKPLCAEDDNTSGEVAEWFKAHCPRRTAAQTL